MDYNKIKVKEIRPKGDDEGKVTVVREGVATGVEVKPNLFVRAGRLFFGQDGFKGIMDGLIHDVFIPSIQNTVIELGEGALRRAILGDAYRHTSRGYDSYGRAVGRRVRYEDRYDSRTRRGRQSGVRHQDEYEHRSDEVRRILFETKDDAMEVFDKMLDAVDEYDLVLLSDFYQWSSVGSKFTDNNWGWRDLEGTRFVRTKYEGEEKWYIQFPPLKAV